MTHPRALDDATARELERWYQDYERVGTFAAKAQQLGVTKDTLRDAIRRVRGQDTRPLAKKLAAYSAALRASSAMSITDKLTTDNPVQPSAKDDVPRGDQSRQLGEEQEPIKRTG